MNFVFTGMRILKKYRCVKIFFRSMDMQKSRTEKMTGRDNKGTEKALWCV